MDPRYTTYYISWTRAILLALFPFVLLLILNGKIIRQLKKSENISSSARVILSSYCLEITQKVSIYFIVINHFFLSDVKSTKKGSQACSHFDTHRVFLPVLQHWQSRPDFVRLVQLEQNSNLRRESTGHCDSTLGGFYGQFQSYAPGHEFLSQYFPVFDNWHSGKSLITLVG